MDLESYIAAKMRKARMISAAEALPGRHEPAFKMEDTHAYFTGRSLLAPYPRKTALALFGLGCFWGAEKRFWQAPGVYLTAVGYAGGFTPNPTYEEVCSGMTGHNEVVREVFDPERIRYQELLKIFWEAHNPTQGFRQGNDVGSQYRSGIYVYNAKQRRAAEASLRTFQKLLSKKKAGEITTEIVDAPEFYFAEPYHQQYLIKNPHGYCGLGGLGMTFPLRKSRR